MSIGTQTILPNCKNTTHICVIGFMKTDNEAKLIRESDYILERGFPRIEFFPFCPLCCKELTIKPLIGDVPIMTFKVVKK